jgi:hypothetical protein
MGTPGQTVRAMRLIKACKRIGHALATHLDT